jgi:hypothetical protein
MVRLAVTGHMDVVPECADLIRDGIDIALSEFGGDPGSIVGVSCIARGADSIFAAAILAHGGSLEVVLPSTNYRDSKVSPAERERFDGFIAAASKVRVMPFSEAGREAYEAANRALLEDVDLLLAVWDGNESKRGGTGTVVNDARTMGIPVTVVWPIGAKRG